MHLSFLTSHNLLFVSLCKTSKNNVFGFSVVCSCKIVQISIFKAGYLKNGLADFSNFGLILQDFDELNLFWRCSSSLRDSQPQTILCFHNTHIFQYSFIFKRPTIYYPELCYFIQLQDGLKDLLHLVTIWWVV